MKKFALLLLMLCLAAAALPRTAMADDEWLGYFYEELNPYGEWVYVAGYGDCWRPYNVDAAWAPYTDGYWAYTEAGWTWVSYEDFGPITYHYGRWFRVDGLGWLWRPGTEWGPAWVSWRTSDDYIGWAPLPPEVVFDTGIGISVWVDRDYDIGPGYYSFCNVYDFGAPVMSGVIFSRSRNVTIINQTVNITNITINRSKKIVYNGGPDYRRISRHSRHHIATLRLDRRHDEYRRGGRRSIERARRDGDRLVVHAPDSKWIREQRGSRPKPSRRVERPTVDKGWASVRDQEERQRIRRKFQTETRGVTRTSAPARPVDEETFEAARQADRARRERSSSRSDSDRREAITEERRERRTEAGRSPDATRPPASSETEADRRARREAAGREGRTQTQEDATRERDRQREATEERSRSSAGRPTRERDRASEPDRTREQQDATDAQREQRERAREQRESSRDRQDAARQQQQREQQERARQQQESARRQQDAARQQQQREQQERARQQQESARRQQEAARQQQQRQQQERARQQQESARRQQENARRQQEAARQQQQRQQRDSDRYRNERSTGAGRDNRDRR